MSQATRKFIEEIKQEPQAQEQKPMGVMEALKEAAKEAVAAYAPGLTMENLWNDVKAEAVQQTQHGAHELAAALFSQGNSGFVMYPRGGKEDQEQQQDGVHGPTQPETGQQSLVQRVEAQRDAQKEKQQDRDQGMSM